MHGPPEIKLLFNIDPTQEYIKKVYLFLLSSDDSSSCGMKCSNPEDLCHPSLFHFQAKLCLRLFSALK